MMLEKTEKQIKMDDFNLDIDKPLISIVTVVFNAQPTLEQTICSITNQSYKKFEYIVIDGGSDDGTIDILHKYNKKINFWMSEPDNGIYDAMNKALDKVNGKWVYFIGAGDILLNNLDKVASYLLNENCIYYGDIYRNDLNGIHSGGYSTFKLAVTNICHQSIFYPIKVFKKYSFNTAYKSLADHNLNMECYGDKDFKFRHIPVLIAIYDGDGYSALNPDIKFYEDKLQIIKKNFPFAVFAYAYLRTFIAKRIKPYYLQKRIKI